LRLKIKEFLKKGGCKMQKNHLKSLDELAKQDFVLIDTNIFSSPLGGYKDLVNIKEKLISVEKDCEFLILMKNLVEEKGNFYITHLVFEEIQSCSYNFKKSIRKNRGSQKKNRDLLELRRKLRERCKITRSLANSFQENDRIIGLREDEQLIYDSLCKKYNRNKKEYGLSDTDFDFLISGVTIAKTKSKYVTLVSNDFGIFKARTGIVKKENLSFKNLRFFIRESLYDFKMIE